MDQPSTADGLWIGLLGPLAVRRQDGTPIPIASRAQRRLLSALAHHGDEDVRSASLEDWTGLSAEALRTAVSRLRRVIGADAIETTATGYRLCASVDTVEFERIIDRVPGMPDREARTALDRAVGLWRDDPLVEFADEPWTVHDIVSANGAQQRRRISPPPTRRGRPDGRADDDRRSDRPRTLPRTLAGPAAACADGGRAADRGAPRLPDVSHDVARRGRTRAVRSPRRTGPGHRGGRRLVSAAASPRRPPRLVPRPPFCGPVVTVPPPSTGPAEFVRRTRR